MCMYHDYMHYTVISIGLLSLSVIILTTWVILLERKISVFLSGKEASSLEEIIMRNQEEILAYHQFEDEMRSELSVLDRRINKKVDGVILKRFNPFQGAGTGGNHSFAAALLDENGDGAVISTLYSREKVSVYAKPIVNRTSVIELTDEEKSVIEKI
jgi:hypothetical protein